MKLKIIKASLKNISDVAPLFDAYRVFYEQKSDLSNAHAFLAERIKKQESVIFIAYLEEKPAGFTQLYPIFSSVSLEPSFLLNDLYVSPASRKKGIAKALLSAAKEYTIDQGFKGLALETHHQNFARKLYEQEGWAEDKEYIHYFWKNPK